METDPYTGALRRIPAGRTITFGELARLAGRPKAARAAGRAVAYLENEDPRPWHRVVRSDGALAPDPERATIQLARLRAEGARPRADEGIHEWARRRRVRFVGAWRDRRVLAAIDERLPGFDPLRVEALRDEEQTVERGFVFGGAARPQRASTSKSPPSKSPPSKSTAPMSPALQEAASQSESSGASADGTTRAKGAQAKSRSTAKSAPGKRAR